MDDKPNKKTFQSNRQMRLGLYMILGAGMILMIAIGLMLMALGVDPQVEGQQPQEVNRIPLAISMLCFGIANIVFWLGFLRLKNAMK